eukprot:11975410-Alexandrium_andersonii.AAC.1
MEDWWSGFQELLREAGAAAFGERQGNPKKPWITKGTMELIQSRVPIIESTNWGALKEVNLSIKKSAKQDR